MEGILPDFLIYKHTLDRQYRSSYDIHCHSFFELYYFLRGDVLYRVEGRQYQPEPHSVLLMAPNVLHGIKFENDCEYERYVLHFTEQALPAETRSFLLAPFYRKTARGEIYFPHVQQVHMQEQFENLIACAQLPPEFKTAGEHIALQNVLLQLVRMSAGEPRASTDETVSPVIARVLQYLNEHLTEPIKLEELSAHFFISRDHLNRLFRTATGTTILQYVNHKRISLARQYILSGKPAAEAAASCGFRDYSVFFRTYRKILGCSPSEDRQRLFWPQGVAHPLKNETLSRMQEEIYEGPPHEGEIFSFPTGQNR